ncbi:MAG TPA: hypothetical protein VLC07_00810 [Solirubrobacterales bacterium]|nr:hypothetical protein [Solirubrobacterales bacterium]
MKAIIKAFYNEPVLVLASLQAAVTTASAAGAISGWIPVATLAVIAVVQRNLVTPVKG